MDTVTIITPQDVHQRIEAFCEVHEDDGFGIIPGYEFAHIVIDDYNLDDGIIEWVIGRAEQWEKETLEEEIYQLFNDSDALLMAGVNAVKEYKRDALRLLHWLLTVPDDVRADTVPLGYAALE